MKTHWTIKHVAIYRRKPLASPKTRILGFLLVGTLFAFFLSFVLQNILQKKTTTSIVALNFLKNKKDDTKSTLALVVPHNIGNESAHIEFMCKCM